MMNPVPWLQMTNMISYQGLVRTFLSCVDGFSENDIYAAGGKGDVWNFDGDEWRQIHFPSNMLIESICCGQDGYVYIGAQSGTVFKGRKDQW
ncbi:hypothetical protein OFC51_26410, partial [Escherichia coli]|nr:hypothetical protein [Escherichia coli]